PPRVATTAGWPGRRCPCPLPPVCHRSGSRRRRRDYAARPSNPPPSLDARLRVMRVLRHQPTTTGPPPLPPPPGGAAGVEGTTGVGAGVGVLGAGLGVVLCGGAARCGGWRSAGSAAAGSATLGTRTVFEGNAICTGRGALCVLLASALRTAKATPKA